MDLQTHTQPKQLEKYSFLWSEARLVIGAVALFLGGVPPILLVAPGLFGLLKISWIISGVVSAYLLYRWWNNKQMLFGGKVQKDTIAFFVNVVSGFNLGWTGLAGNNIGMSISSNRFVFIIVGVLYLVSAWHLYQRWNTFGKKIF